MEQEVYDLRETINNPNPLVRLFFKWKFRICINIAKLKKEDLILDFGCGGKYLKRILPNYNVVSYDYNPEFTEIKDYKTIKPTKIFAIDVFEHLTEEKIIETIKDFKSMNENFSIITAIPNENWFWRFSRKCLGLKPYVKDHITNIKDIVKILDKELVYNKKINFFLVSHIYKYNSKK